MIASGTRVLRQTVTEPGRYGVRLLRGQFTEAVGTPIWFRTGRPKVTVRGC